MKKQNKQLPASAQINFQGTLSQSPSSLLGSLPIFEPKQLVPLELSVAIFECDESWRASDQPYSSWSQKTEIEILSLNYVVKDPKDKSKINAHPKQKGANDYETCVLWTTQDEQPVDGQDVHLVYARYGTGDSFGHHSGSLHIIAAFTDLEIAKNCLERFDDSKDIASIINDEKDKSSKFYAISNTQICSEYVPWNGYFESLESIELKTFQLKLHHPPSLNNFSKNKIKP